MICNQKSYFEIYLAYYSCNKSDYSLVEISEAGVCKMGAKISNRSMICGA